MSVDLIFLFIQNINCDPKWDSIHLRRVTLLMKKTLYPQATTAGYGALLKDIIYYPTDTEPGSSVMPARVVTTNYDLKQTPACKDACNRNCPIINYARRANYVSRDW